MKRTLLVFLAGFFGVLAASQSYAADLSCFSDNLVILRDEDRCNAVPLENQVIHALDAAARDSKNVALIWGEREKIQQELEEACAQTKKTFSNVRVIWIQDSQLLLDSFREELGMTAREGVCGMAAHTVTGSSARDFGTPSCSRLSSVDGYDGVQILLMTLEAFAPHSPRQ